MAIRTAIIESGVVSGVASGIPTTTVFKGIPYAAPPIGDLRWKEPQPVKKWEGEYKAWKFPAIPMQDMNVPEINIRDFAGFGTLEDMSEDCLYLHVWTPAESIDEKLPVMVWIHGGGMYSDFSYDVCVDGDAYCRKGVILVSVEYRMGAFGFLAHPELTNENEHKTSGNFGMLDQMYAIKWVKRNIASFGGDPDRITIFGQSAGGISVINQICSPLTKGDIKAAAIMSGGGYGGKNGGLFAQQKLSEAEKLGVDFLKELGVNNITEAREISADDVLKKQINSLEKGIRFSPCVDGYFLTDTADNIISKNLHHNIPTIIGCTENEISLMYAQGADIFKFSPDVFKDIIKNQFGDNAEAYLIESGFYEDPEKAIFEYGNSRFVAPALAYCELMTRFKDRESTYLYWFDRKLPGDDIGACHAADLYYVFNTIHRTWRPMNQKDLDTANAMTGYFANLAKNQNPNGEELPEWKQYSPANRMAMELGEAIRMIHYPGSAIAKMEADIILER